MAQKQVCFLFVIASYSPPPKNMVFLALSDKKNDWDLFLLLTLQLEGRLKFFLLNINIWKTNTKNKNKQQKLPGNLLANIKYKKNIKFQERRTNLACSMPWIPIFLHSILLSLIIPDKIELRNNYFSKLLPISPPALRDCGKVIWYLLNENADFTFLRLYG